MSSEKLTDNADQIHRFSFDGLPIRGQWVRLKATLAAAFRNHTYPEPVRELLATQFAAVAMFADNLKFQGAVALQSKGDGALLRSLTECREQHKLRGIAHLNSESSSPVETNMQAWLGTGQLALTLTNTDSGHMLHQAMIELQAHNLAANLEHYFTQSEQLPTLLFFSQTRETVTGLLLQRLPEPEGATEIVSQTHEEAWQTATLLANTLYDDPHRELAKLSPQSLLQRLFSEFPCRLHPPRDLIYDCSCSRAKSNRTLLTLSSQELHSILDELGHIHVDCEFCGSRYSYDAIDVAALAVAGPPQDHPSVH